MKSFIKILGTTVGVVLVALFVMGWAPDVTNFTSTQFGNDGATVYLKSGVQTTNILGQGTNLFFYDDTNYLPPTLAVQRSDTSAATASSPTALLVFNTNEVAGGSDWQNETILVMKAGTVADHRKAIWWRGFDNVNRWLDEVNSSDVRLLYDNSVHRLWMERTNTTSAYRTGNTYISGAGAGGVIFNKPGPNADYAGTGPFQIWSGGTSGGSLELQVSAPMAANAVVTTDGNTNLVTLAAPPIYSSLNYSNTSVYWGNDAVFGDNINTRWYRATAYGSTVLQAVNTTISVIAGTTVALEAYTSGNPLGVDNSDATATVGQQFGFNGSSSLDHPFSTPFKIACYCAFFSTNAVRHCFAVATASPATQFASDTPTGSYVQFLYNDTNTISKVDLLCETSNGSSQTVVDSGYRLTQTGVKLMIEHYPGVKDVFYTNGVQCASIATTLPGAGNNGGWMIGGATQENASKTNRFFRITGYVRD